MKLVVVWSVFKVILEICTNGKQIFNQILVPRLGSGHQHGFHTNVNFSTQ